MGFFIFFLHHRKKLKLKLSDRLLLLSMDHKQKKNYNVRNKPNFVL